MDFDLGSLEDFITLPDYLAINYFEIENKYRFKNTNIALGIPLGYYEFRYDKRSVSGIFAIDPRLYLTFSGPSNQFELNIIPKAHIFISDEESSFYPGMSLGMGFSTDLNKWAIRPEIGYDGSLSLGLGLNIIIGGLSKEQ